MKKELIELKGKLDYISDSEELKALQERIKDLEDQIESPIWTKARKIIALIGSIAAVASTIIGLIIALI